MPPIPNWTGLHPILVHFPIALLLVAPLLMLATMIIEKHTRVLSVVTLCLVSLGTMGAFLAARSGEAASRNAEVPEAAARVLEQHADLAELTVKIFAALLVVHGAITAASIVFGESLPRGVRLVLNVGFLMLYIGGDAMLAKTAHAGGQLVHQYGIRNINAVQASPAPRMALIESSTSHHRDDD